jgi:hypothetical protein
MDPVERAAFRQWLDATYPAAQRGGVFAVP